MKQTCAEIESAGGRAISVVTDVSKEADCAKMAGETLKAFGRIDILVNNAGIAGPTKRITDMSLAEWHEIARHRSHRRLARDSRAVLPTMDKQGGGNILIISSGAGRRGYPMRSPYAAAKWAMIGLTQTLAGEWGQRGIRVNCICPGAIAGERIERVIRARAEAIGQPYEQVKRALSGAAALHRMVDRRGSRARRAVPGVRIFRRA